MKHGILSFLASVAGGLLVSSVAHAQSNLVLLISEPGDYVGQGQTSETTNLSDFAVSLSQPLIQVTAFGYDMYFSGPGGANLAVGTYSNAVRWPFNGSAPGLSIFGNGRGCNTVCGDFQIRELSTDGGGNLTHLWLTFTQHCECSMAPMTGDIRFHSLLAPTTPPAQTLLVPSEYPNIQSALDAASEVAFDSILVSPGVYTESVNFEGKPAHLMSTAGPSETFIVAPPGQAALVFNSGETSNSIVSGFTITNGGVSVSFASPTIVSNVMVNCGTAVNGYFAAPNVLDNLIIGCSGNAIYLGGAASAFIEGNVIETNGGGIGMFAAGSPTIINNLIQDNNGDGLSMVNQSDANIIQNIIVGNSGSGISALVPSGARGPVVVNNTMAGNTYGVSISGYDGSSEIINNILIGNGAVNISYFNSPTVPVFQNNDIYSTTGNPYTGVVTNLNGIDGNISADPLFACPAGQDFHIVSGSPCIDAGTNGAPFLTKTDFDGNPRVLAGHTNGPAIVDMGAYEFNPSMPVAPCSTVPTLSCPDAQTVECDTPAMVTVQVGEADGGAITVVWALNGSMVQTNRIPPGPPPTMTNVSFTAELPLGTNLVEVAVANSSSNTAYCSTTVTVVDTIPPVIQSASASPNILWPPNHQMTTVAVNAVVTDNCGPATWKIIGVQSNESVIGPGAGNTATDWQILDNHTVALRAERSGTGSGRIYTITIQAEDVVGNLSTGMVTVTVPRSMGK